MWFVLFFCRFLLERDDMKFYQKSKEELLHSYDVKIDRGLSSTQVSDNRERYGENKLPEEKEESYLKVFFKSLHLID